MANDDEAARRARAEALRQRIAALKSGETSSDVSEEDSKTKSSDTHKTLANDNTPSAESPREFVQRKMRELDRDKKDGKSSG